MLHHDFMIHRLTIDCIPCDIKIRLHSSLEIPEQRKQQLHVAEGDTGCCFLYNK